MSITDLLTGVSHHEYTWLMLEGWKHQAQRITQGTKIHSDVKKRIQKGKVRFKVSGVVLENA